MTSISLAIQNLITRHRQKRERRERARERGENFFNMPGCFSFTESLNWCLRYAFSTSGLRSTITDLHDGTVMHCWVPKTRKESKPNLLLLHGFGVTAMWQWSDLIRHFSPHFNLYLPDLLFFGDSFTTRPDRSDSFQAQCVMRVMEVNSVRRVSVVGLSYGGFVAYSMAAQFKEVVERVVICCAGVCLEDKDIREGMFKVSDIEEAANILVPQTPEKLRELLGFVFLKPPKGLPNCLLEDFIDEMCTDYVQERKELIRAIPRDRKLSDLPKISQPTLIIWGENDQVFPVELGHRLKGHLGQDAQLVVIKNAGHSFIIDKPKEFYKHLKTFLIASDVPNSTSPQVSKPQMTC